MANVFTSAEEKKQMQRALVKHSDMNAETETEVLDIVVGAIDKFTGTSGVNFESASRLIKDTLDKQYGVQWHCVMGEGFSFDITSHV